MPNLAENYIHLGLGAAAVPQPPFTGMDWYADYISRTAKDGIEGRLVSLHTFTESWTSWEMHPKGDEIVVCISGNITLIQEQANGENIKTVLTVGDYAINAPGIWHTADVDGEATALFITAGWGTEHRPR